MLLCERIVPRTKGQRGPSAKFLVLRCDTCRSEFERKYRTELVRNEQHFCSKACLYAPSAYGGIHVQVECANCGIRLERLKSQVRDQQAHLCGKDCVVAWKAINKPTHLFDHDVRARALVTIRQQRSSLDYVHPFTGKTHTAETRSKLSRQMTLRIVDGRAVSYGSGRHINGWHHSTKALKSPMYYRSSWEVRYMEWLDENPNVTQYSYECLRLSYVFDGVERFYVPDFRVAYSDGYRELVEFKPSKLLLQPQTVVKLEAGKLFCVDNEMNFVVMTEHDIKRL